MLKQEKQHSKLQMVEPGLFISMERPYIGASPDAIVSCECCGKGVVEVKCPFCFKDKLPEEDSKSFCMSREGKVNFNATCLQQ